MKCWGRPGFEDQYIVVLGNRFTLGQRVLARLMIAKVVLAGTVLLTGRDTVWQDMAACSLYLGRHE